MNINSLEYKKMEGNDTFYQDLDDLNLQVYSIILAVFICYYLRITDNATRNELKEIMNMLIMIIGKAQ